MGRLIINNAVTVNGAFEAPTPDTWFVLDADTQRADLEQWLAADAMLVGRKTYEGLAAVWPQLANVPGFEAYAGRMNSMPKFVASRTLSGPLEWNATLLDGDLAESVTALKTSHDGNLVVPGCGELAHDLTRQGLVDELRFWVQPFLWPTGPRIFAGIGPIRMHLTESTTFPSGVVLLCYRPEPDQPAGTSDSS